MGIKYKESLHDLEKSKDFVGHREDKAEKIYINWISFNMKKFCFSKKKKNPLLGLVSIIH